MLVINSSSFCSKDTATPEIYTLSLHDALPISSPNAIAPAPPTPGERVEHVGRGGEAEAPAPEPAAPVPGAPPDRKSTRLNSSHSQISYAVFCLKKKKYHSLVSMPLAARSISDY